jgi:hypothetical protein|tara:strand:+ start:1011 stop:1202 length:192 start_codon:yes stop_codon:yes gene_type:complete
MTDVNDLINALKSDSSNDANNTFAALMQGKINGAMDDRKIAIAQGMTGTSVETEDEDFNDEVQ